MTVAAKRRIAFRDEDGVTLNFPVPFRYMSSNELEVARIEDGGITILTEETEWTASDGDSDAGGTVTLVTTKAGAQLRIRGKTSRAQTADYTDTDAFPAEAHERALDREAMAGQDRDVDIEAALKVPAGQQGYSVEDVGEGQVIGLV
ncbi:MAG: hypothetical protein VX309_07965, partial [Pseudomonadota bacterium]|nr:hypothetical protein [Pseudomonadota bacterium]